jgi:hypothetical protein
MANQFTHDVFLSHSSTDKVVVRDIAQRLRADGLRVWLDDWEIQPGDNIPAKIEEGLERSRVLVFFMSSRAFGLDWARLEAGTFRFRDPLNRTRRLIPVRLDDARIKGTLAQFSYIDWRVEDREPEYAKLLEACRQPASLAPAATGIAREQSAEKGIQLETETEILTYAFSQNGQRALTGAVDGTVRLWDAETGRCLCVLEGHRDAVVTVAWSAGGRRAFSGDHSGDIRVWDLSDFVTEAPVP